MNFLIRSIILTVCLAVASSQLRAQSTTYIQIAHNCADPNLDTLDIYFNGAVLDSNVVYHSATGLFAYTSDNTFTIGVNLKHSNGDPNKGLLSSLTVTGGGLANQRNAYIISGVSGTGFAPNPDGIDTGISIKQVANLDSAANDTSQVDIRFLQDVTDLPEIKITNLAGTQTFAQNLKYGDAASTSIRHTAYEFLVTSQDGSINYGTFYADLTGFSQQPVIIMLSGFLDPAVNDSGPALGLYLLQNTGAIYTLPLEISAFQLLHNCADPAADSLDIYINGKLSYPGLGFRNATPALLLNAHATYDIGIARKNSSSVADTFWHQVFTFPSDTFFIATASGLLSQTGFAPNPQGISTAFQVLMKAPAEYSASSSGNFDFFMLNGVTDAPPLNLLPTDGPTLLSNVQYASQTSYISLPAQFYTLNVQDTSGNTLTSGFANFLAFPAQSGVLITSGFYNPTANNNGPSMNLYMVPVTGGPFIPLYGPQGVKDITSKDVMQIFPNPATNQLNVAFTLAKPESVSLQITDLQGNLVKQVLNTTTLSGLQNISVDLNNLSDGIYFARLKTSSGIANNRFVITR